MRVVAKGSGRKCGDGTSVGLFIPLPVHLAKKFPTLIPDDHSPSHVTLLIIGEVTEPEEQKRLVEVLQKICSRWYWKDAKATLGEISAFDHGHQVVPHMEVKFSRDFASFRRLLKQELAQEGFKPSDKYVEFQPHVTLDYLPPGEEWEGKTPKGSWTFDKIEVWGLPDVVPKIQLGKVKTAYGPNSGMRELQVRLARLIRSAKAPTDVVHNLPMGVDFVWEGLDQVSEDLKKIPELQRTSLGVRLMGYVDSLQEEIRLQANALQAARLDAHTKYHRETEFALQRLLRNIRNLASTGANVQKVESLLLRMFQQVYP